MRTNANHEEMRKEWIIENWYEKVYYVSGVLITWWMIIAFFVGVVVGFAEGV